MAAAVAAALGCASSPTRADYEKDYDLRWSVNVYEKPDDVRSCTLVTTLNMATLPCVNILPGVSMAGTECARFWTVERGGDTLLVKGGNVGDVYVCRAPLLPSEGRAAAK